MPGMKHPLVGEINMRNKIVIILALFAVMAAMTGIAAAVTECGSANNENGNNDCLESDWTGTQIHSQAWDGSNSDGTFYYQIRYYQPGTYDYAQVDAGGGEPAYSAGTNDNGYFSSDIFEGLPNSPRIERLFTSPIGFQPGTWMVVLMKDGNYPRQNPPTVSTQVVSLRVDVPVDIPIPEFSTVAIPVAAVLGLVFFFQHRKKKEE